MSIQEFIRCNDKEYLFEFDIDGVAVIGHDIYEDEAAAEMGEEPSFCLRIVDRYEKYPLKTILELVVVSDNVWLDLGFEYVWHLFDIIYLDETDDGWWDRGSIESYLKQLEKFYNSDKREFSPSQLMWRPSSYNPDDFRRYLAHAVVEDLEKMVFRYKSHDRSSYSKRMIRTGITSRYFTFITNCINTIHTFAQEEGLDSATMVAEESEWQLERAIEEIEAWQESGR